jgi:aquaporin Z
MFGRKKVAALLAEFLGTATLTLLILSVQRSQLGLQYFVALGAGIALTLLTFAFVEYSGGFFNPAITLGLWTARKLSSVAAVAYIIAQMVGALAARGLYSYFANTHLSAVGGTFKVRILIAEAVGTFVFSFIYSATIYKKYNSQTRAAFAGFAYTLGILLASSAAIGLLNPAVALGINAWVWGTYVLGPVVGAIIGINLYTLVFAEPAEAKVNFSKSSTFSLVKPTKKTTATKKKTTTKKK